MKRRVIPFLAVCIMLIFLLPIRTFAIGGYYVVKGEREYHSVLCDSLCGYEIENLIWYSTSREVKNSGFKVADCCIDAGFDYEQDGDTYFYAQDGKIQNALELERLMGIIDSMDAFKEEYYTSGYDEGSASGYDTGYDEGFSKGKEKGYDEGYDVGFEEGRKSEETGMLEVLIAIAVIGSIGFYCGKLSKKIDLEDDAKKNKQEIYRLRSALKHRQQSIYILDLIAEKVGRPSDTLVDDLFVNFQKARGYTEEEAKELLLTKKSEFSEES